MLVTEYMTGSVGDYIRNTEAFSDATFEIIMKNVYECWKHMVSEEVKYVGDDFKLDNIVHLGKSTMNTIKCNAVGECTNDAAFMSSTNYKTYYCKKHKPIF